MHLSPQQRRVVNLLQQGHTHREIAQACGLSIYTVQTYLNRAMIGNGCRTSIELAVKTAIQEAERGRHEI